ncbi:MAG: aminotransferase class I/II-fold pyridoxal phosphate-dependent enzyme [Planctomycetes bacterium]|nr:aminotransferase class I/II-fold pyridoxal phosphate-dependent enzyme [Planctomycetota bacterium]
MVSGGRLRLAARGVVFHHRDAHAAALDGVDLAVSAGEVVVVLGPNGSGKSTLLRLCAGLLRPAQGSVQIDGRELADLAPRERARLVAWVPQSLDGWPRVDVRTFVESARYAFHGRFAALTARDRAAVDDAMAQAEVAHHAARPLDALSGGERQRVIVARALAQEPALLLCDEPTASLDVDGQVGVLELCARAAGDRAVLIVTHDLNLAAQFGDRLVLLQAGRVVADGTPDAVLSADVLQRVYGRDLHHGRLPDDAGGAAGRPLVVPRRRGGAQAPRPPARDDGERMLDGPPDAEVTIGGRRFVYFGGTSYLGLHARRAVIDAGIAAMARHGLHAATSRTGFGETPALRELETELVTFTGAEHAFAFATGWAGTGIWCAPLRGRCDVAFVDERSHYAVREALLGLGVPIHAFAHRDPDALARALLRHAGRGARVVVGTDGVFPITGAIAPLDAYVAVLDGLERPGDATLVVDDAHGLGVLGAHGRGTAEHHGLAARAFGPGAPGRARVLVAGTLSKALGGFGGLIAGAADDVDAARRDSHWLEGASAPPVPVAASSAAALRIVRAEPELRDRLRDNVTRVRHGLASLGLEVPTALPTPAIGFTAGGAREMRHIAERLREDGLLVPYFPSYSGLGPDGALRIAVFATHRPEHLALLLNTLRLSV